MIYIVTYDIRFDKTNDSRAQKRLREVSRVLQDFGLRRQRSVFECILEADRLELLKKRILRVIDRKRDSIRIYPLCEKCLKKTIVQGIGEIITIQEYEIV
ncbi:MAG TPA: CRISPR-associated endonuclease Cas2 [Deltaproteobacteria bacterium]|nr:CRISPR-associated endonuclease Cas2 [Deltaproteobacteria bacterium]